MSIYSLIMARPLSEDRRSALLEAAAAVFAEHGLQAPTALISKTAKVSEGSFFTYFKTKDELIAALYQRLRLDLASAVMGGFPSRGSIRERLEHVWTGYVSWGAANPVERRALRHVTMSKAIGPAVRAESGVLFAEVERLHQDAIDQRKMRELPPSMASQALKAFAEMTMDLIERDPKRQKEYMAAGFQMLWGALAR